MIYVHFINVTNVVIYPCVELFTTQQTLNSDVTFQANFN